jgi:adenosyl cobinamide kinase/adenosyl cobinamide phosphate guanylyltransferase
MTPEDPDAPAGSGAVDVVVERIMLAPEVTDDSSTAADDVEVDAPAKSVDEVSEDTEAGTSSIVVATTGSGIVDAKGSSRSFTDVVGEYSVTRSEGVRFCAKDIKDSNRTSIRR